MYRTLDPVEYFRLLVEDPDSIPLVEAAASIALDAYPELDLASVLDSVDELGRQLAQRCAGIETEQARLAQALRFFHSTLGFAGNVEAYYAADNSYLHKVIETRRGIPITLAVLFVELTRQLGLDAHGVSFPGHFLVRVDLDGGVVIVDPFTGTPLDRDTLERIAAPHGLPIEDLLDRASARTILARMLGNLHQIHLHSGREDLRVRIDARLRMLG